MAMDVQEFSLDLQALHQFELDGQDFLHRKSKRRKEAVNPSLVQKIENLHTLLMRLVDSNASTTPQQHWQVEKMVDQLTADANAMLVEQQNCSNTVHVNSSSSSSSNASSFMEKFDLEIAGLPGEFIPEQEQPLLFKTEVAEDCSADEFLSYLMSDDPLSHDQTPSLTVEPLQLEPPPKAELDEEIEVDVLPPGSYDLIELHAMEILAEHTHFCDLCGKGFKRDANLRMHMRGHGDEYKSIAALAKPKDHTTQEQQDQEDQQNVNSGRAKRYSCPFAGCKRHKLHPKFMPLKTVLCVKNHYRRSHCPKMLSCSKCNGKKFSVMADLRTHEKHCGREKWQCSCGTTFSRKDKLLGHVSLFFGHKPIAPRDNLLSASLSAHVDDQNWSGVVFPSDLRD